MCAGPLNNDVVVSDLPLTGALVEGMLILNKKTEAHPLFDMYLTNIGYFTLKWFPQSFHKSTPHSQ